MSDTSHGARGESAATHRPSAWHWISAGLGLAVIIGAFAYLIRDAVTRKHEPYPVLRVTVDTIADTRAGFVVRVRAHNDGGTAAANVHVQGELQVDGAVAERGETTIDYVPPGSSRAAGLVFVRDPRAGRVDVRPVAFDIP